MDSILPVTTTLPDGRRLAWYEFGDRDGIPCIFHPGAATSGLAGKPYDEAARRAGVRLLSVDRPGLGHSDPRPGRRLRDWADDTAALADAEGLDRFTAFGHSGGGSHALALPHALADRIPLTVVAAGLGPYDEPWMRGEGMLAPVARKIYWLTRHAEPLARIGFARSFSNDPDKLARRLAAIDPATPDGRFYRDHPDLGRQLLAGSIDAARQGTRWAFQDLRVPLLPWGFTLAEVTGRVAWWHGSHDHDNVTLASGRATAERLPNCVFHEVPDAGHMVPLVKMHEILTALRESMR